MKPQEMPQQKPAIVLEKTYPHSPERVWQALTDPNALTQWLLPTTFQPVLGHRFHFTHRSPAGKRQKVRCQVVELEAPCRLAYTWQTEDEDVPTLVTWTLEAVEEGVRLRLEHVAPTNSLIANGSHVINTNVVINTHITRRYRYVLDNAWFIASASHDTRRRADGRGAVGARRARV